MPEPFKNLFNDNVINMMAMHFKNHWPDFDITGFVSTASNGLNKLELKARSEQITKAMIIYLPSDFLKAGEIMLSSLMPAQGEDIFGITSNSQGIAGWAIMPMTHYVGIQGHEHFTLSMTLFKEMTQRFSSEFGIRFFILESPKKTLATLKKWTTDDDRHVRRLVSEGTRPRLPWAMQLPLFIKDPLPIIDLLERLKDDKEEYVRRSVANNLNDISKDHPDLIAEIALQWMQEASKERRKLIYHACRTLVKSGHKKTLQALGFQPPQISKAKIDILTPEVTLGSNLEFVFSFSSTSTQNQALMIDYIIHHQKKNGTTSPKVFKWKKTILQSKKVMTSTKKHSIKKITTRTYYSGLHSVEIIVNGISVGSADFQLIAS